MSQQAYSLDGFIERKRITQNVLERQQKNCRNDMMPLVTLKNSTPCFVGGKSEFKTFILVTKANEWCHRKQTLLIAV